MALALRKYDPIQDLITCWGWDFCYQHKYIIPISVCRVWQQCIQTPPPPPPHHSSVRQLPLKLRNLTINLSPQKPPHLSCFNYFSRQHAQFWQNELQRSIYESKLQSMVYICRMYFLSFYCARVVTQKSSHDTDPVKWVWSVGDTAEWSSVQQTNSNISKRTVVCCYSCLHPVLLPLMVRGIARVRKRWGEYRGCVIWVETILGVEMLVSRTAREDLSEFHCLPFVWERNTRWHRQVSRFIPTQKIILYKMWPFDQASVQINRLWIWILKKRWRQLIICK